MSRRDAFKTSIWNIGSMVLVPWCFVVVLAVVYGQALVRPEFAVQLSVVDVCLIVVALAVIVLIHVHHRRIVAEKRIPGSAVNAYNTLFWCTAAALCGPWETPLAVAVALMAAGYLISLPLRLLEETGLSTLVASLIAWCWAGVLVRVAVVHAHDVSIAAGTHVLPLSGLIRAGGLVYLAMFIYCAVRAQLRLLANAIRSENPAHAAPGGSRGSPPAHPASHSG